MDYKEIARGVKADSFKTASLSCEVRDGALKAIIASLREHKEAIFLANKKDLQRAAQDSLER